MNQELLQQIGQIFRQKRIKKNYSLEKISEITKISIKNLIYIEEGNFQKLPGKFYEKSFIKIYSEALRIKNGELISMYLEANKEHRSINQNKEIRSFNKLSNFFSERKLPSVAFLSASLIIFSFIIIFQLFTSNEEVKTNLTFEKDTNNSQNFIKELEDLKKETPIKNTNLNVDDFDYSQNFQNNEIYFNEILAVNDVWLEIKDSNDSSIIATLLKKNETFSIPNEEGLKISVSNAGVVKIKKGDTLTSVIGSFGTILDSVSLDSLLNKY